MNDNTMVESTPPAGMIPTQRKGSWQSRRKMITLWIFAVLGVIMILGNLIGAGGSHSSASTPPVPTPEQPTIMAPTPAQPSIPTVAPVVPSGSYTGGDYEVPSEMQRGKYKTTGDAEGIFQFCMATTYGDVAGEKILNMASTNNGPAILVVGKNAKRVDFTGDCVWVLQKN